MSRTATQSPQLSSRRHRHGATFAQRDSLEQGLGWAIEAIVGAVLILSPLAFGSVEFAPQWWILLGLGAAVTLMAVRWIAFPQTMTLTFTLAYVPIVLFLLLVVLQTLPLSASLLSTLSPRAAAAWSAAAQALPGVSIRPTLSLYPLATERHLRLVLIVATVFFIVLNHFRDRDQIIRLLAAMVASGGVVGAIAISQNLIAGPSMWLDVQTTHPDSGPFMNHSAFGQFMNLCIGAALALLLIGIKHKVGDRIVSFRSLRHHLLRKGSAALVAPVIFLLVAPVLIALSLTRGGVLSFIIAGAIAGIVLGVTQSGRGKRTLLAVLGFLVLLVALKFGFDQTYDRMATLRDVHETGGGVRLQMLRDMAPMARDFPIFGVGLGAFSHVFPSYDTAAISSFATHAENEYAQLLVETGLVGISLIALFILIVLYNTYATVRFGRRSIHAGAVGLMYGFLAILIHSASDFGQHVPAIACLTAATTALLVRLGIDARASRATHNHTNGVSHAMDDASAIESISRQPSFAKRGLVVASALVFLGVWGWMLSRTTTEARAEALWMQAKKDYTEMATRGLADASDGEFIRALGNMSKAADLVPNDADYSFGLNVTRWQSIDRYDRALTAGFLEKISQASLDLSATAPYFGPAVAFAGQVRYFDLGDDAGIPLIRRGRDLAPYSREASFAVALLDAREKKWDECMANLRHAISLGASRSEAAQLLAERFERTDLAIELVEGSRTGMISLAQSLERMGQADAANALLERSTQLLITEASKPDAPVDAIVQLADAYMRAGHHEDAIPLYRRALAVRFDRSEWRTALIHALVAAGDMNAATSEARTNYRLNPGNAAARELLEDLVTAPTTQLNRPK